MGRVALLVVLLLLIKCLCIRPEDSNSTRCIEEERQALLTMKKSFGGHVERLRFWQGRDCCGWEGVRCDESTGHVLELDLRAPSRKSNDIPTYERESLEAFEVDPSLMKLKYLKYLDLSGNDFHWSSIPSFLGQMKGLTYLNLSFACFGGRVPHHVGNLSNLEFIDFRGRYYTMYVDDLSWVSSLSSLRHLDMGGVDFSAVAPKLMQQVLSHLPSLLHLGLSSCKLNPHLFSHPSTSFTFLPLTLRYLDLSSNYFHGMISNRLQNLTSLEVLDLSHNYINSSIPLWLGDLKNLKYFCLASNELSNPDSTIELILRNLSNLHSLDLSSNQLTGIIPPSLGKLISLSSLDLSDNKFTGIIPSSLGRLISLSSLDLSNNKFTGIIPSSLGRLISLSSLDLSNNQFLGIIPSSFGRLTSLSSLNLWSNQLTGSVPSSLGRLGILTYMDLSRNKLNETISASLGQLSNLIMLDLSNNQLHGIIPVSIGQLASLTRLDLDSNELEGVVSSKSHLVNLSSLDYLSMGNNHHIRIHIDPNWIPPFQLRYIELRSCKFKPKQFPTWVRTQNQLQVLDLSNTSILDTFPLWLLESKPFLQVLDLSQNLIKGPLPSHLVNGLEYLNYVTMSDNMLNGSIPNWFCNITNYHTLDLSKNKFSGHIPNCWNNLQHLEVIYLSSNELSGTIPNSFQNLSSLKWLLLSNNNLTGPIPLCLRNVRLSVLDLGDNRLSGNIPTWIGESFPSLQILNLRNNMFNGNIPPKLCLLSFLRIMILAGNDLEGKIPICLGHLTTMTLPQSLPATDRYGVWSQSNIRQVLKGREMIYTTGLIYVVNMDLSGNRLVGSIPQELTQLLGLVGLNLSRNQLTGSIPKNIGDLRSLQSLDLSHNQLSGEIPNTLSSLTFLSYLNLSNNNLVGKIPRDNQLLTFNDPSIYEDNPQLCGPPLMQACPKYNPTINGYGGDGNIEDKEMNSEKLWFYVVVMVGYAIEFWAVVGVLLVKRSWRRAYFTYVDEIIDKAYIVVAVKMGALKKKMKKTKKFQPQ